jgi:proteic killer suppression protein
VVSREGIASLASFGIVLLVIFRFSLYVMRMIRTVKGTATRQFIETGKSKFSGLDAALADRRMRDLDAAGTLKDLSPLASMGLHKLAGDRKGFWSVKVNGPWRIVFRFEDGDAYDVEIVDYH